MHVEVEQYLELVRVVFYCIRYPVMHIIAEAQRKGIVQAALVPEKADCS